MPRLYRRRSVLLPTFAGALCLASVLAAGAILTLRALPGFLATDEPVGHGILVVEGWLHRDALRSAAETYRRGGYDALVVSGGPIEDPAWGGGFRSYAERAAAEMRKLGIVEPALVVAPAPASAQERTYRSAISVREWLESSGRPVTAVDVFSSDVHARRTRTLYRMALGEGVEVGVRSASPSLYHLSRWWRSSEGAKSVLGEAISYAWTLCCFRPGPRGSHEELWAQPEPAGP